MRYYRLSLIYSALLVSELTSAAQLSNVLQANSTHVPVIGSFPLPAHVTNVSTLSKDLLLQSNGRPLEQIKLPEPLLSQFSKLTSRLPIEQVRTFPVALPSVLTQGLQSLAQDNLLPVSGTDLMEQVQSLLGSQLCSAQSVSEETIDFSTDRASKPTPIPLSIEVNCQADSTLHFSTSEALIGGIANNNRWAVALKGSKRTVPAWIVLTSENQPSLSFKVPAQIPTLINLRVSLHGFDPRQLEPTVTLEPLQSTKLYIYQDFGQELSQAVSKLTTETFN